MSESNAVQHIDIGPEVLKLLLERQRRNDREIKNLETQVAGILPNVLSKLKYVDESVFSFNPGQMDASEIEHTLSPLRRKLEKEGYKSRLTYSKPQDGEGSYQLTILKEK